MTTAKKIILGIVGAIALAVFVVLGLAATKPDEYSVTRSRVLASDVATIMPHLTDLQAYQGWSPWADIDPNQVTTYSDPPSGVGAWTAWDGNEDVGKGKMSITSVTETQVVYDLQFIEPFEDRATVTMSLTPEGEGTRVSWGMDGHNSFMGKLFSVFMDMDEMIGADFERGFDRLGAIVE